MNNPGWMAGPNWQVARIEGVNLNSGTGNSIVVSADGGFNLDDITVSTAGDLAKADPHRRVLAASATDRANLVAYLQQLDRGPQRHEWTNHGQSDLVWHVEQHANRAAWPGTG
jgi:hypothetical protein